jgi:hypothetical protein
MKSIRAGFGKIDRRLSENSALLDAAIMRPPRRAGYETTQTEPRGSLQDQGGDKGERFFGQRSVVSTMRAPSDDWTQAPAVAIPAMSHRAIMTLTLLVRCVWCWSNTALSEPTMY